MEPRRWAGAGRWLAAVCAVWALAGCGDSPEEVYYGMATAAEMGDLKGFLNGFTEESKPIIQAQISLSEAYDLRNDNPVRLLVFSAVERVEVDGDRAVLDLSTGNARQRLLMVKTDDGWRIDTRRLAEFWKAESGR